MGWHKWWNYICFTIRKKQWKNAWVPKLISSYSIFCCFGINYEKQSREKIWLIGWSAAMCVWVLEQVNIMNLVRCLFWIAICFLWRDKNICLATIRLYFASLTHAIRTYIVKYSDKRIVAFLFSVFLLFFFHYYFSCSIIFVV